MKFLAALCATAIVSACVTRDPLPPLLRGAATHGGSSPCPTHTPAYPSSKPSPSEFSRRLATEFPAGSNEITLLTELKDQGFVPHGTCDLDPSMRIAKFHLSGTWSSPVAIDAFAYWKLDEHGRIAWTSGEVWLTGP